MNNQETEPNKVLVSESLVSNPPILNTLRKTTEEKGDIKKRLRPQSHEKREKMRQLAALDFKRAMVLQPEVKKRNNFSTSQKQRRARERERCRMINSAFDKLRKTLDDNIKGKRLTQLDTLQLAITYIKNLSAPLEKTQGSVLPTEMEESKLLNK